MINPHSRPQGLPTGNPLANAIVVIVGVLVIALSLVLGFFAFIVLGSIFLVLGAVMAIRLWWFQRKLRKQGYGQGQGASARQGGNPDIIEGEFRVVDGRRERDRD